jgi:hypothetical protein
MLFIRSALVAVAILGVVTSGVALAQTTTPPSSTSSKIDDASKWTTKHWNQAKAKWVKQKETARAGRRTGRTSASVVVAASAAGDARLHGAYRRDHLRSRPYAFSANSGSRPGADTVLP